MKEKLKAASDRQRAAHAAMTEAADAMETLIGADDADALAGAQAKFDQSKAEFDAAEAECKQIEQLIEARTLVPRDLPSGDATAGALRVKEEAVYKPYAGPYSYFRDLASVFQGGGEGSQARDRLFKNNAMYQDHPLIQAAAPTSSSTAGGEFDPPTWYVDQYAAKLRAGRPFLNALGTKPLPPDTVSLNFPKITTGSSVAVQTDGNSVSQTNWVTTSVTAAVQTEAGRVLASYQFIDLGPISDQVIMQDLGLAYDTQIDSDSLNGNVSNALGLLNVSSPNTVTYTSGSPTGSGFYGPVAQGASQIAKNAFVGSDLIVTHPSVWYNIVSGLDGNNRPLWLTVGPGFNLGGDGDMSLGNGVVGNIAGIPVVVDANIPTNLGGGTNQASMVVLNRRGFDFWESQPRFRVADQTSIATLQYQFVQYGYYACTSRQSKMISILSGTGLIPVSGF